MTTLVALPVYNEAQYVRRVLTRVLSIHPHVVVIDDGSTDQTPAILAEFSQAIDVIHHAKNSGYGQSLIDAFAYARAHGYEWLITMDCDEQHEPAAIPHFIERAGRGDADIISGSRYLLPPADAQSPPKERRAVNAAITAELNARLSSRIGTLLTDSFCGFKTYRVESLGEFNLSETGYAFPMQFWAQAAAANLQVREMPVRLIYNDPNRSFGAALDDPTVRLAHYRDVLHKELLAQASRLPARALAGLLKTEDACRSCVCHPSHRAHKRVANPDADSCAP